MTSLRNWIAKQPTPSSIRVERADGEEKLVRVGVTRSKVRDAESAIGNDAVRCEALDESGAVLRVWESDVERTSAKKEDAAKPAVCPTCGCSPVQFVELLAEGSDRSVGRHVEFVNLAFTQMGELLKLYAQRNAMLEKAWHKLLVESAEAQAEAAGAEDPSNAIIGGIVQAALMPAPQAPATSNGKAKGKA